MNDHLLDALSAKVRTMTQMQQEKQKRIYKLQDWVDNLTDWKKAKETEIAERCKHKLQEQGRLRPQ